MKALKKYWSEILGKKVLSGLTKCFNGLIKEWTAEQSISDLERTSMWTVQRETQSVKKWRLNRASGQRQTVQHT